jgi:hypothetical protein
VFTFQSHHTWAIFVSCTLAQEPCDYMEVGSQAKFAAIFHPIVPPFATRSARVVGNVEASGGERGNV